MKNQKVCLPSGDVMQRKVRSVGEMGACVVITCIGTAVFLKLGFVGNGSRRLLLCSQPWPMLCIACCPGMHMGKCARAHKTSSGSTGLEAERWRCAVCVSKIEILGRYLIDIR